MKFPGFFSSKERSIRIPGPFFHDLLPEIDHLGEIKVTLFAFWFLEQQESNLRVVRFQHFLSNRDLMKGLNNSQEYLTESLQAATERGSLLSYTPPKSPYEDTIFVLNSPYGRSTLDALQHGAWSPEDQDQSVLTPAAPRPNIFKIYEENIGPLTPIIADTLKEATDSYPQDWIEQAIEIAVQNNVRRWKYVEAILKSWKERGRDEKNRRDNQEDPRRFIDGEYGEFFQH